MYLTYPYIYRKLSDGLFLQVSKEVAKEYPDIEHNDMIIDNCCMQLVSKPHQFDVMLMPNLYGTIISNVVCGLIGGAGLLSGCNYGDTVSPAAFTISRRKQVKCVCYIYMLFSMLYLNRELGIRVLQLQGRILPIQFQC